MWLQGRLLWKNETITGVKTKMDGCSRGDWNRAFRVVENSAEHLSQSGRVEFEKNALTFKDGVDDSSLETVGDIAKVCCLSGNSHALRSNDRIDRPARLD